MSWKEKLNRMAKEEKKIKEREEREKKRKEKESKEAAKKKAKFLKQVKPVIKKVIPYFLKGFGLKKNAVYALIPWDTYSWIMHVWVIRINKYRTISINIGGGRLERPHLLIYGEIWFKKSQRSQRTKKIKMFLEDINEKTIANALIEIEKEISKLKE